MSNNAQSFILARRNPISITRTRINSIFNYIIYCYLLSITKGVTYSKSTKNSKQKFEDYLKTKLVDDYLRKNKDYFKATGSGIENISFGKEEVEIYTNNASVEQEDKIDIYIRELGLQNTWSKDGKEEIYFAIECKRIESLPDTTYYIGDIKKYVERKHTSLRLPFEGMIAFIENNNISPVELSAKISEKLKQTNIDTIQFLTFEMIYSGFNGSYISIHKKNFDNKDLFTVIHLLLDYSKIVVN